MDKNQITYSAVVEWTGAANGSTRDYESYSRNHRASAEGKTPVDLSVAERFNGNPGRLETEELLLFAVAGCHMMTYLAVAARRQIEVCGYVDRPSAILRLEGNGGHIESMTLRPHVTLAAGSDLALAEALHRQTSEECFIGTSMKFPIYIEDSQTVDRQP